MAELVNDHKNEDNEIDQFLVEKIKTAIDRSGESKNLITKVKYAFKDEFKTLLSRLERKTSPEVFKQQQGDWLSVRRANLYALNNLVTEWQFINNHPSLSLKEVFEVGDNIKKSLKKIKKEISSSDPAAEGSSVGSTRSHPHQDPNYPVYERHRGEVYRWSSRHAPRKVHGFEHMALAMVRDLVMRNNDAPFKVFGVGGAAGIGKTTLCQDIFGRGLVTEHFSPRIWVCLSKKHGDRDNYNEEIVVRMLKCLGIEDEVINDAKGLKRLILLLRLQLIGKRYLIVLDDAWNEDKFFHNLTEKDRLDENWGEELAYGLPKGYGGTVISSSTSEDILRKMLGGNVSLQHLKPLTDEIIYEIFKDAVIGYDDEEREFHKDLDQMKTELLKKCAGIPLAAKLLAKIAWKNLDMKPKSQQTPTAGGDGSRGVTQAPAGGHDSGTVHGPK